MTSQTEKNLTKQVARTLKNITYCDRPTNHPCTNIAVALVPFRIPQELRPICQECIDLCAFSGMEYFDEQKTNN